MNISKVKESDLTAVLDLLTAQGLPVDDIAFERMQFYAARKNAKIIATAAVVEYGENLLLRSVAVQEEKNRQGTGSLLVNQLLQLIEGKPVYLLTEHATGFFEKMGFQIIDRADVPDPILQSRQFSEICPASAVCMRKK